MEKPPSWRLPEGVSSSLWDYIHSDEVAAEYDQRLASLFRQDAGSSIGTAKLQESWSI